MLPSVSKLGSHIDQVNRNDLLDDIITSGCRIAFVNADMGAVGRLAKARPDMTIITRHWKHPAGDDARRMGVIDDPEGAAHTWWQHTESQVNIARAAAGGDLPNVYWQGVNEPVMTNADEFDKLNRHEVERMKILEREGLKAGIFAFATGVPQLKEWEHLYPALAAAHAGGHLLVLHEYFAGLPWIWYGDNQNEAVGRGDVQHYPDGHHDGWLFGRYRKVWRDHIEPHNWTGIRIAITELGSDMVGTSTEVQDYLGKLPGAWKDMVPAWNRILGPADAGQRYIDLLAWCDEQMQHDPYVVGGTVFTDGTGGANWGGYDIHPDVSRRLYEYIALQQRGDVSVPPVEPPPGPPPPAFDGGHALEGIHGPADPGSWALWQHIDALAAARPQAVKLLTDDAGVDEVNALHQMGASFIMARLFAKIDAGETPQSFVAKVRDGTRRLYDAGVRWFEVHNEPNLNVDGMWKAWQNGHEFGAWFVDVVALLRQEFPDAKWGWPGLSPGPFVRSMRYDERQFLAEADSAVRAADFVCCHTYWAGNDYGASVDAVRWYCQEYPTHVIMLTEFANVSASVTKADKGRQYTGFWTALHAMPRNFAVSFIFVLSASSGWPEQVISGSPIPDILGSRTISPPTGHVQPGRMSIVGDSLSVHAHAMLAEGWARPLIPTAYHPLIDAYADSFRRKGFAVDGGWLSSTLTSPSSEPECSGQTAIACELQRWQPSIVFVMLGTNDPTPEHTAEHLPHVVEAIQASGAVCVLMTIPPHAGKDEHATNTVIKAIAQQYGTRLIDYHAAVKGVWQAYDGVHPDPPSPIDQVWGNNPFGIRNRLMIEALATPTVQATSLQESNHMTEDTPTPKAPFTRIATAITALAALIATLAAGDIPTTQELGAFLQTVYPFVLLAAFVVVEAIELAKQRDLIPDDTAAVAAKLAAVAVSALLFVQQTFFPEIDIIGLETDAMGLAEALVTVLMLIPTQWLIYEAQKRIGSLGQ